METLIEERVESLIANGEFKLVLNDPKIENTPEVREWLKEVKSHIIKHHATQFRATEPHR